MLRFPRPVFYGWWIAAGGFVLNALGGGLLFNSFGAYFVYFQADFGWSRALVAGAISVARLQSGILGPAQGWFWDLSLNYGRSSASDIHRGSLVVSRVNAAIGTSGRDYLGTAAARLGGVRARRGGRDDPACASE